MRNKIKTKKTFPLPGVSFTPALSTFFKLRGTGNTDCSQSIMYCLCRSFFLILFPFSNVLDCLGNRLLYCGSPMDSQVLASNLLQFNSSFYTGPQVLPGVCSPWSHNCLQGMSTHCGPPQAAGGFLLHCRSPWFARGRPVSSWSSPQSAGHLLPLLLHMVSALVSAQLFYIFSCLSGG